MSEHNDKSKTEVFDAFTEEKPIVSRVESDAYSRARESAYSEDYYDDDQEIREKRGLTFLIIIITVLLCGAIIWGAYIFAGTGKEKEETPITEETVETENSEEEKEEAEQEKEEEVVIKPDVVSYKVAFQSGTIEKEGGKYTVRVNLYDSSMNKTDTRRLVIDESTEIREGNEKMSLKSFIYLLESSGSEAFVCDARVDEKSGILVSVSYSKKNIEKEEEKKEEDKPVEEEKEVEEETKEEPEEENPENPPVEEVEPPVEEAPPAEESAQNPPAEEQASAQ